MSLDLTKGNPVKLLFAFALPMLIGNVFQQFYNTVDSIVVGQFDSPQALAAVGSTFPVVFLIVALSSGMAMGVSVIISQYFGARRYEDLRRAYANSLIFMFGVAVVLTVISLLIVDPVLRIMNSPPGIRELSADYLYILFSGLIFTFFYNAFASILRAVGDSKTPLYFLIVATLLNIVLDLVFVINLHMSAAGVAIATVMAQAVSVILCVVYIYYRKPVLRVTKSDFKIDTEVFRRIVRFGVPSALQQSFISVGMMAVQGLINSYGGEVMAAFSAAGRIDSFAIMPMMNLGLAMSTFVGQNIGAGHLDRIKTGVKSLLKINISFSLGVSVLVYFFAEPLIRLFIKAEETGVIAMGVRYLHAVAWFYLLFGVMQVFLGTMRGAGDVGFTMLSSILVVAVRTPLAYLLAAIPALGWLGTAFSIPAGWGASALFLIFRYVSGRWKEKSVVRSAEPDVLAADV